MRTALLASAALALSIALGGLAPAHAQDDMRAAFANLYLKGGADKLPPVESLAMFYDNIDLTPIGADGDEPRRQRVDVKGRGLYQLDGGRIAASGEFENARR